MASGGEPIAVFWGDKLTCEYHQAVAYVGVADLAASQQYVVQVHGVAVSGPLHRPRELIQTVVGLLTVDHGCGEMRGKRSTSKHGPNPSLALTR